MGTLRNEADVAKAIPYTDQELIAASPEDLSGDIRRHQANVVELRKEIAGAKDPAVRKILQDEYNRLQGGTSDSGDNLMDFKVYGQEGKATPAAVPDTGPAPMNFRVYGQEASTAPATPQEATQGPNPAFGSTNEGAATGMERPRLQPVAPGREPTTAGPAEQRTGIEATFGGAGAAAGSLLGGIGEPLGAGVGGVAGSLVSEVFDPTQQPIKEALQTGAIAAATAGLSLFGAGAFRYMLGKPSANGQHLLNILELEGKVPTAGAVLEGSLAKNMQAIGSADAFFGKRVQEAVKADGNVVTDRVRNYVSSYQRFYGGAKEGFKIWDNTANQLLGPQAQIVALDRGVIDKLKSADRVWTSEGAAVDFPLRSMLDDIAAREANGETINAFRATLEQAEAVRQLLHQRAAALSGTARTEGAQAIGQDVARAVRDTAYRVGDDINVAIDHAVRDGRIPEQTRGILKESQAMWQQWKQGEAIQDAIGDTLKHSQRSGEPITSENIFSALKQIDADSKKLKRAIITPEQEAHLMGMAKALQANESAAHNANFNMTVRAGQLFTLSGGAGSTAAMVPFALVPSALGWIVRDPTASALLIRGLRLPAGSRAAVQAAEQLGTMLAKEGFLAPVERKGQAVDQTNPGQP